MKQPIINLLCSASLFMGCAMHPKGTSTIKSKDGKPSSISYVTAKEIESSLKKKIKDETDLQIELKMIPKGGRLVYDATHYKVSYSEQNNTLPFISIVQSEKEIKFCDDSEFKSQNQGVGGSIDGVGLILPLKANTVEIHCDINRPLFGEFEVRILDQDKKIIETYVVTTSP
jgi:hypothetical protein